jgi:hypothetical protein
MHPAMAVWIWSMAMARAWQPSSFFTSPAGAEPEEQPAKTSIKLPNLVLANPYLKTEIAERPLPDSLLDRLAELYWTERESELAI